MESIPPNFDAEVGCVRTHFLDSGAFTQWTAAAEYAKKNRCGPFDFFRTDAFFDYLDRYADFVKKYVHAIDLYANVDVIPLKNEGHVPIEEPKLTWRNQKYLEREHNLRPVPVVHYKEDLSWLSHYIDKGYDLIGLGGLVGSIVQEGCVGWIERCFELVCDTPDQMPKVKLHGFGVTSYDLMLRFPWYSVDSTSWTKVGAYGGILIPHKRQGKFTYTEQPYLMKVSIDSEVTRSVESHFLNINRHEQAIVQEWLEYIGVPLGKYIIKGKKEDGTLDYEILEFGVTTRHTERRAANLLFFEEMLKHIPEYPWAYKSTRRKGFGLIK